MKLAATVIYVDDVPPVLEFYRAAFGLEPRFVDLDVKLPERSPHGRYHYAVLATENGSLQFGTHDLGTLLMPAYARPPDGRPSGVEIFFYATDVAAAYNRALEAGAQSVAEPKVMPWGQTVAYLRSVEGTFIGVGSPLPEQLPSSREEKLRDYFRRYARVSLGPEPEELADFYDTSFLVAGPKGGAAFKNDESFLAWLREIHAFNARTGLTSMTVGEVCETPVAAGYTLMTVTWVATFRRTGETPIRFSISYLLRELEASLKVAAYVSHEDQEDVMRAHGLL